MGNNPGDTRVTLDTGSIYTWNGSAWILQSSTSPGVNSVIAGTGINLTGTVTDPVVNLSFPIVAPESSAGSPQYAFSETGTDTGMGSPSDGIIEFSTNGGLAMSLQTAGLTVTGTIAASNFPPTGNSNTFAGFDNVGALESIPGFNISTSSGGMNEHLVEQPNNAGGDQLNIITLDFDPLQNSPNDSWNLNNIQVNFDINSSGFSQGTNGQAITINALGVTHNGTGNIGNVTMTSSYANLGNGTDPITIGGVQISTAFPNISAGVTVTGQVQGYGFQPAANAATTLQNEWIAFYDFSNIACAIPGYQSFAAGPNIAEIKNNTNYNGLTLNGNFPLLTGNASYFGVAMSPIITAIPASGSFQGININPTVTTNNNYAVGLNINMNNVTNFAGTHATLVVQDITYTINAVGTGGNSITVEYTNTVLAGNEVATLVGGQHIVVQIESGVSTATQVHAALLANVTLVSNASFPITGVASNPQVTYAQTNLAGGIDAGRKLAIDVTGDVAIQGSLSFTGALALGQLNSFAPYTVTSGLGVASIDTLITAPSIPASATITGTDLLAINTAMLLSIGNNASVTSSFLGYAALGLPAVLAMGTGSTIDRVEGAVFAISLDASATGGTAGEVDLCRALAIPNGATTVIKLIAYEFDLPFGDPGTTTWGVYMKPSTAHNYMAGDLKVGDGSDVPANSSVIVDLESTTKAFLPPRMTTAQKNLLTAIAGMMVFDTTLLQMSYYNGTVWVNF